MKKSFRNRAVGAGFYENVSYVFSERALLEKYGFPTVEEALELANKMNAEFCKKHRFYVNKEDDKFTIMVELACPNA